MKLMCKCGNIEDLKTDVNVENYKIRNSDEYIKLLCKRCSEVVIIKLK